MCKQHKSWVCTISFERRPMSTGFGNAGVTKRAHDFVLAQIAHKMALPFQAQTELLAGSKM